MRILASFLMVALFSTTAHAGLVGYWRFDGNTDDSSGQGNHGQLMNGAGLSGDVPGALGGGQSLQLGGGTQHVLVPHHSSLDISSAMTISAWVKPIGNVAWDGVLAKSPSDGSVSNHAGNYELRIENGSRMPHFLYQRGGVDDTTFPIATSTPIPGDVWSHLAVTVTQGGTVDYYLDGVFKESVAVESTFGATNTSPLYIGSRADLFTTFDGLLDDVAIFNQALSAQQIASIAGGGVVPEPSSALLGGLAVVFVTVRSWRRG